MTKTTPSAPVDGAADWPDLAGRLIVDDAGGKRHQLPVRVYFEDTDFSTLVYHASYVRWCERGRSDFLRLLGSDHRRLIDGSDGGERSAFVVRRMTFDFYRPARIDEILLVETSVKEIGGASLTLTQQITRDGQRICEADVIVVLITVSGKPIRIAEEIRRAFGAS